MSTNKKDLLFSVQDKPPILTAILQVLVCASSVISIPLVLSDLLCANKNERARVNLVGTTLFFAGFSTIVQSTFGVRLPIMQGPNFAFLASVFAFVKLPEYQCPNMDNTTATNFSQDHLDDLWMSRMTIIQGTLVTSAAIETFIGLTGLMGIITRFVGPLTIAPMMIALELSVVQVSIKYCSEHWISIITVSILLLTLLYMHEIKSPVLAFSRRKKCHINMYPVFAVFPYLIAICISWILCVILTASGTFHEERDHAARTDTRAHVISEAPWFRWPYPGQWGPLKFNFGVFLGMLAATLTSVCKCIGAYQTCAFVCEERSPPSHAINRGVLMEGLCSIFGSLMGASVNLCAYSENIGAIGITKVASRRTMQFAGCIFILLGLFTKFGAILATIPDPIIGGILTISLSIAGGVGGISTLRLIDLHSSRNTSILGIAIMFGAVVPSYIEKHPVTTGNQIVDDLLNILLSIQIFVAGITGFILDNTVPGATRAQRGISDSTTSIHSNTSTALHDPYTFPLVVMKCIKYFPCSKYLPFLPDQIMDHNRTAVTHICD